MGIPVILLPGLHGTRELFAALVAASPDSFEPRPIAYPSHRVSTYSELAGLVTANLPSDVPFILLAESFSGPVAVQVAAQRPRNLITVVLAASFVKAPRSRWFARLPWRTLFSLQPPGFVLWWLLAGDQCPDELLEQMVNIRVRVAPRVLASRVAQLLSVNSENELANCTVPVLYLRPRNDRLVTRRTVTDIRARCPRVSVAEVDSSHFLLQTNPRECWRRIAAHTAALT